MENKKRFRVAIRIPEVFYVLRDHESREPDRFDAEEELIKKHQQEEIAEPVSEEVQLGRDQIDAICKMLKSEYTTDTKNITKFKSYTYNLKSSSREAAIEEVKSFLLEMRELEENYTGDNISSFFQNHWIQYGEDFYFILKSIDLAGIRIVRDSHILDSLTDEQKIVLYFETY